MLDISCAYDIYLEFGFFNLLDIIKCIISVCDFYLFGSVGIFYVTYYKHSYITRR